MATPLRHMPTTPLDELRGWLESPMETDAGAQVRLNQLLQQLRQLALPELDGGVSVYGGLVYEAPHRFRSPAQVGSEDHPDGVANDVGETLGGSIFARAKTGDFTTLFAPRGRPSRSWRRSARILIAS